MPFVELRLAEKQLDGTRSLDAVLGADEVSLNLTSFRPGAKLSYSFGDGSRRITGVIDADNAGGHSNIQKVLNPQLVSLIQKVGNFSGGIGDSVGSKFMAHAGDVVFQIEVI